MGVAWLVSSLLTSIFNWFRRYDFLHLFRVLSTNEPAKAVEIALERVGGKHHGNYRVDCTVYKPTVSVAGQVGQFFMLHHSSFPDSACCFGDPFSTNPNQEVPSARATADLGFELIMQKFSASLIPDQLTRFEVNGSEYHLKDFRVRVGTALVGTSTKVFLFCFQILLLA